MVFFVDVYFCSRRAKRREGSYRLLIGYRDATDRIGGIKPVSANVEKRVGSAGEKRIKEEFDYFSGFSIDIARPSRVAWQADTPFEHISISDISPSLTTIQYTAAQRNGVSTALVSRDLARRDRMDMHLPEHERTWGHIEAPLQ
jgi:hypothetical protein